MRDDGFLDWSYDWSDNLAVAVNNAGRLVGNSGWNALNDSACDSWFNHAGQNWLAGDDLFGDERLMGNDW